MFEKFFQITRECLVCEQTLDLRNGKTATSKIGIWLRLKPIPRGRLSKISYKMTWNVLSANKPWTSEAERLQPLKFAPAMSEAKFGRQKIKNLFYVT